MNMQALMRQAQQLQNDMMKAKEEIDNMEFTGTSSFVSVVVKGDKTVKKVTINNDEITSDDKEMIEDMLVVALNDAMGQIDKVTEQKMGKFNSMMPGGLF